MLVDRSGRIWAMRPDETMMAEALRQRAARGEGEVPVAAHGETLEGSDFATVIDGVAIVPVRGMLMRKFSSWFWSYEEIARDLKLAQADSGVRAIVLDIDSPGGLAAGCGDLARAIAESGPKPVEAFVGGMAASAAYWIASAARRITVGSGAILGSIGTVIEYVDLEPMFEKMGARIVRIVAKQSPNKRLDPDSAEGKAEMQALVDAGGAEFVAAVAANRGVTETEVLDRFGQGLVFDGGAAIGRGMADRRGTLEDLIAELAGRDPNEDAVPAAAAKKGTSMDWNSIDTAALRKHRADIASEIEAQATEAATRAAGKDAEAKIAAAVTAERERILAIDEIAGEGHDDLVAAARADGKTTAAELALNILKAEKAKGGAYLAARAAGDAAAAVPPAPPAQAAATSGSIEDRCKAAWDKDADLRAEFADDYEAFLAYEKKAAAGHARILKHAS